MIIIGDKVNSSLNKPDSNFNTGIKEKMASVLSNIRYSNVYDDHDGAVKTLLKAKNDGVISINKPVTLIHFDTHSDIKKNNEPIFTYW